MADVKALVDFSTEQTSVASGDLLYVADSVNSEVANAISGITPSTNENNGALLFGFGGMIGGSFNPSDLGFLSGRIFGTITNQTMIAVPLFVFMGVVLEKSKVAEKLLDSFSVVFGRFPGGLGLSVTFVGMLMAASTGIVGATVVTMGLMSLPTMLRHGYDPKLATGAIAATGTLGQIIPPSIALVLLGDVLSSAYQQAQLNMGIFSPDTVSVGDLFAGALFPGLVLVAMYMVYVATTALLQPARAPRVAPEALSAGERVSLGKTLAQGLFPPLLLIIAVLGSIMGGIATPTEASGVGALGAYLAGGEVTSTIRKGIIDADVMEGNPELMVYGMLSALLAAGTWLMIASVKGWPVSTTHSIVGANLGYRCAPPSASTRNLRELPLATVSGRSSASRNA